MTHASRLCRPSPGIAPGIAPGIVAILLAGLVALGTAWPTASLAQQNQSAAQSRDTRKTPAMRESVFKQLSAAQSAADLGEVEESIRLLDRVKARGDLNSYELAQMYNFYAFIYYSQDRYDKSIEAYEQLLAQPNLPEALEVTTLYGIAQLSLVTEDYAGAVDYLERWFRLVPDAGADAHVLLAQAYYQQGRLEDALAPVEKALRMARNDGRKPKENWLLLARALNFELGHYGQVVEILETLLAEYPRTEYWAQLAAMYGETGQEKKQLVAYEIAHEQGALDSGRELVLLAQLYLQQDVPYKAAVVLEEGMSAGQVDKNARNYRLLSQAWVLSMDSDKAVAALKEAARLSDDPELYLRLSQQYAGLSRWSDAMDAASVALEKGLDDSAEAHMMIGMARFNLGELERARRSFSLAAADERNEQAARQWIDYIGKEQARKEQLARAM